MRIHPLTPARFDNHKVIRFSAMVLAVCAGLFTARATLAVDTDTNKTNKQSATSTALTIYSSAQPGAINPDMYVPGGNWGRGRGSVPGYAMVKQEREFELESGVSTVRFSDVASQIDPTTVSFASLTDPSGTRVLEQNYQFDLVSSSKLMERYLDKHIRVEQIVGDSLSVAEGVLLSTDGGLVLQQEDGSVQIVRQYANVQFPELPGGLITKPTLVWRVAADKGGTHNTRVGYQTDGMTWWADYNIVFSEGENANAGLLDIGAWVSIINQSGATYDDAKLKLIAGDVHRAPKAQPQRRGVMMEAFAAAPAPDEGFEEKAFFEYHLYTLGRPTTLPDNSTKQLELFPTAHNVPAEKVMVYYGQARDWGQYGSGPVTDRNIGNQSNKKIDIYLRFKNSDENKMGMPLPAGRIRVSKLDPADDSLEFIGEDAIDHTPKNEEVLIKLGSAFDVVGERTQVDFSVDTRRKTMEETIEIQIRNHKEESVKVLVKENLYRWVNWKITDQTHDFEKIDARTVHFPVTVEADGEVTIRYTVRYSW